MALAKVQQVPDVLLQQPDLAYWRAAISVVLPELNQMSEAEREQLLASATLLSVPADTQLMQPGSNCEQFVILLEGEVRVYQNAEDGREVTLYRIEPGNTCVISLYSLLHNRNFNAVAESVTPIRALAFTRQQFLDLMGRFEAFRVRVLTGLTECFCETLTLVQNSVFSKLETRLACLLGSLFEASHGAPLKITHQELANELGTTREVISRILKTLERQQCISLSRGSIGVASPEKSTWFSRPA